MNQSALILTQGLTTATIQMHRPTIIFFFRTKSQPFNKKQPTRTINQIKQSEKTIPATTQSKAPKDKHNKQLRQNAMFLNIIISQTETTSEPTANTPFIKTQRKYTRQNNITYTLR